MRSRVATLLATTLTLACASQVEPESVSGDEPETLGSTDEFQATAADFGPRDEMPGAALYTKHCANCHNGSVPKAPHFHWLEMMSAPSVLAAMNEGIMQQQAAALTSEQRRDVAEYVTLQSADAADQISKVTMCDGAAARFAQDRPPVKAGWGHDTDRRYGEDVAGLTANSASQLKLKWSFAYPGALRARSQPAAGYGAIYTGSQDGTVYALDLESGCARWTFKASAEVRTGIVLSDHESLDRPIAIFGDILAKLYAVDAWSGELVWSVAAHDHPSATLTGTPALSDGRVFVPVSSLEVIAAADPAYPCCTFRGKLLALEVATGNLIWEHFTIPQAPRKVAETSVGTAIMSPSGAPTWTSPAVDEKRNVIYIGTGENYSSPADSNSDAILAIDMSTGKRVWQRQSTSGDAWNVACMMKDNPNCPPEDGPDFDHGSSMILVDLPDDRQVLAVGHKNGTIFGLDPDAEGALLWSTKVGRGSIQGGVHFGMAADDPVIYAPINDMNNTYNGDELDAEAARPGVHAIDARSGDVLWSYIQPDVCDLQYCDPGISAPISAMQGAVVAGHLDGYVRILDRQDGRLLWEYDTKQPVMAVNELTARGGGMSGAGPLIVDGHVVVNSGYGLYFHEPGNMLAVFSIDGE